MIDSYGLQQSHWIWNLVFKDVHVHGLKAAKQNMSYDISLVQSEQKQVEKEFRPMIVPLIH